MERCLISLVFWHIASYFPPTVEFKSNTRECQACRSICIKYHSRGWIYSRNIDENVFHSTSYRSKENFLQNKARSVDDQLHLMIEPKFSAWIDPNARKIITSDQRMIGLFIVNRCLKREANAGRYVWHATLFIGCSMTMLLRRNNAIGPAIYLNSKTYLAFSEWIQWIVQSIWIPNMLYKYRLQRNNYSSWALSHPSSFACFFSFHWRDENMNFYLCQPTWIMHSWMNDSVRKRASKQRLFLSLFTSKQRGTVNHRKRSERERERKREIMIHSVFPDFQRQTDQGFAFLMGWSSCARCAQPGLFWA